MAFEGKHFTFNPRTGKRHFTRLVHHAVHPVGTNPQGQRIAFACNRLRRGLRVCGGYYFVCCHLLMQHGLDRRSQWHVRLIADRREIALFHALNRFSYPVNLAQAPATVVPCGFDRDGLPIGLQVVGRRGDDAGVLAAAEAVQAVLA